MSNDEDLTRKAIEEILREAEQQKRQDEVRPMQESKINPLRRANKQFLGRTLNAVVRHNERSDERIRKKCRKKLKDLDRHRLRSRSRSKSESPEHTKRSTKRNGKTRTSNSSDLSEYNRKKRLKSKRKKKHKRRKKQHRERSSSESSSSSTVDNRKKFLPDQNDDALDHENANIATNIEMQNYAAWMLHPMMQIYHYNALMELGIAAQAKAVQIDEVSISSSSLSDVNFDEVDNSETKSNKSKVMLTIDVTTDDDESSDEPIHETKTASNIKNLDENNCIEVLETDDGESDASKSSSPVIEVIDSDCENITKNVDQQKKDDHSDNASIISLKSTDSNHPVDLTEE